MNVAGRADEAGRRDKHGIIARRPIRHQAEAEPRRNDRPLIYRQSRWTRLTHWLWAISLFFMLLSGLQIFNARPAALYRQAVRLRLQQHASSQIGAENTSAGPRGYTEIFGHRFDTTGVLGWSGPPGSETARGFPSWATIPSYYDLGTARVVHFFFAWILTHDADRLAGRQPDQRPYRAAIWRRASTTSSGCRATSSTTPG